MGVALSVTVDSSVLEQEAARNREALFTVLFPELVHDINSPFSVVESTFSNVLHTLDLFQAVEGQAASGGCGDPASDLAYMMEHLPDLIRAAMERAWEVKQTAEAMLSLMNDGSTEARMDIAFASVRNLLRGYLKHRVHLTVDPAPGYYTTTRNIMLILAMVLVRAAQGTSPGGKMQVSWGRENGMICSSVECTGVFHAVDPGDEIALSFVEMSLSSSGGQLVAQEADGQRSYRILFPLKEGNS